MGNTVVTIVWALVQWEPLLGHLCVVSMGFIRSRAGFDMRHSLEGGLLEFVAWMV